MQLPLDAFACEELPWAEPFADEPAGDELADEELAGGMFGRASSPWAPQIAATVSNNTKPVFFIVDLQIRGSGAATPSMVRLP
jgi:hypothetical protein